MTPAQFLQRMKSQRINLAELSRRSGVHVRALRRMRNDPHLPRQSTVDKIAPYIDECKQ